MTTSPGEAVDTGHMKKCFALAAKGRGMVSPNPLVGAVIVVGGKVVGTGYHKHFGGNHAEVNAVHNALRRGVSVEGATLYVSLEPCFHHGKTPPCVDMIIERKFARVVVAVTDPNPLVSGKGVRALRAAGIRCEIGICDEEAKLLNEQFFGWFKNKRPFVALKTAQTCDGFIAKADGSFEWITNAESRKHVHAIRASYDAVLVGAGTVIADDPMLTVRSVKGTSPLRILLDGHLRVPLDAAVVKSAGETGTIVYTATTRDKERREKIARLEAMGVIVVQLRGGRNARISVPEVLADLGQHMIISVLVEGGADVYREFLRAKVADILYQFTSPKEFGKGIIGIDSIDATYHSSCRASIFFGNDRLDEYVLSYE